MLFRSDSTFGSDTNRVAVVDAAGVAQHETMLLSQVADLVLDELRDLLRGRA